MRDTSAPSFPQGETIRELVLTGFTHDGRCVARREGEAVVFVRGGLPGQRVLARLDSENPKKGGRFLEADLVSVLDSVPDDMGGERPAPCPHAAECGGCPWQTMPYAGQLVWKERLLTDALARIGRLRIPRLPGNMYEAVDALARIGRLRIPTPLFRPIIPSVKEWGYRNKMEFAFAPDVEKGIVLGLRRRNSRDVVEVPSCMLAAPRMMRAYDALREATRSSGLKAWDGKQGLLRHAVLREAGELLLVELICAPATEEEQTGVRLIGEKLLSSGLADGFVHSERRARADIAYGERTLHRAGKTFLTETLNLPHDNTLRLRLGHDSFFQVNTDTAARLYGEALLMALEFSVGMEDSSPQLHKKNNLHTCWDVYCGVGGLALTMAPYFDRVLGLESVAPAVELARKNANELTHVRFECADAARLGEYFRRFGTPDLLVCDPPRAGMDEKTTQAILRARPEHLILVSCNPATLARDLARLAGGEKATYELLAVRPVDMFPHTPHVECVTALKLK